MGNEVIKVSPELQRNLDILSAIKAEADKVGSDCQKIQITDELSLSIAQQNLSKANGIVVNIEEKRKVIKAPYLAAGTLIDNTVKDMLSEIKKGLDHLKKGIGDWEQKKKDEETRKQKILDYINITIADHLERLYKGCRTVKECDSALNRIRTGFPGDDKFGEYKDLAYTLRDRYITLIETLSASMDGNATQEDLNVLKEEIQSVKDEGLQVKEVAIASVTRTKGIRHTWDFELVDIKAVPAEWMKLDEDKVKEYLAENKGTLKDGQMVHGVKFFKKIGVTA
jgi:hypothetical protein